MDLLKDNYNICWCTTDFVEEIFISKLAFSIFQKMFSRYILPLTRKLLDFRKLPSSTPLETSKKVLNNRKHIATHVKSVYESVKVFVVKNSDICDDLIERRIKDSINFIGLDCEWNSNKKSGVALIQLSSGNDCILYQVDQSKLELPTNLKTLLEDRKILKFGVAIQEDARRLRAHGVNVKGFVDLRHIADRCIPIHEHEEDGSLKSGSLQSLSTNILEMTLNKNFHIRCGNWEKEILSLQQILYAAKDAIVSLEIFYALILLRRINRSNNLSDLQTSFEIRQEMITNLTRTFDIAIDEKDFNVFNYSHSTDLLTKLNISMPREFMITKPSACLVELGYSLCQGITDRSYVYRAQNVKNKVPNVQSSRSISTNASKKQYKHQCREKPLYENCFLLGPDKNILATVNKSKADWYLHKKLGVIEKESPFTVRLLFEPSGRPMPDADYYTTCKDNLCVVCGSTESFVRKMIIPHDYRRHFPDKMKDHMSHDVLLMCLDCHRDAQRNDEYMRQDLAREYNAPMGTKELMQFIDNPQLGRVRSAAKALLNGGSKIPEKRREELQNIVKEYYKVEAVDDELLKSALKMNIKEENKKFQGLHGERVVRQVVEKNKLPEFIRMWRQNFLDSMNPQHLPPMWSVDHNLHKLSADA